MQIFRIFEKEWNEGVKVLKKKKPWCCVGRGLILQDTLVLSTELILRIGHRREIEKLTFRMLAICQSEELSLQV